MVSPASLQTLPSVECLDSHDFLSMFESHSITSPRRSDIEDSKEFSLCAISSELSAMPATPTTTRFPELHGTSTQRFELSSTASPPTKGPSTSHYISERIEGTEVGYRSSVSSSNPSTKRSNASSRRSRKSSMTSMSEDMSSSERSSKGSDKENALHERLKRRSRDKGVSFGDTHTNPSAGKAGLPRPKENPETQLPRVYNHQQAQSREASSLQDAESPPARPLSRGKRLGKAMADSLTLSPPTSPMRSDPEIRASSAPELPRMSSKRVPRKSNTMVMTTYRPSRILPRPKVDDIDRIRVGIMSSLDNVDDLRNCAQVSKDFYLTFQKYETLLVDRVLYQQSPAAWALRHSVRHLEKPSPFRLRSVQRDFSSIHALEDFMVWKCESILRSPSLEALLGGAPQRKAELEDAIWRIWTFCNVFGKTSMSDATLLKQTQWLNGPASQQLGASTDLARNNGPLTMRQLEDMSEMWRCLEMLLSGFKGREDEARQAGLFDNVRETKVTDRQLLSLWIYDILSLGPKAVLTLSSCDFEQAKVLGITRWTPPAKGKSRSNFLKAAVEEVYRDRLMKEARQKALDYRKNVQHNHKRCCSDPEQINTSLVSRPTLPQNRTYPLRVDTRETSRLSMPAQVYTSIEERFEVRPDCDPLSPMNQTPVLSPSTNPWVFSPLAMTKNASTKLGATLFPIQNRDQSHRLSVPSALAMFDDVESERRSIADVIDPTDQAVALMVHEMGFSEAEAKRALAMSDTGSGINVQRAIEMLAANNLAPERSKEVRVCELPASTGEAKLIPKPSKHETCEGHCKPLLLVEPRRERISGLGMVKRGLSYRMSFRHNRTSRLSVIPDDEEVSPVDSTSTTRSNTVCNSALSNLTSSAASAFTAPILPTNSSTKSVGCREEYPDLSERSPVSPVTPAMPATEWLKPDIPLPSESHGHLKGSSITFANMPKPRITLQRVGTGIKKTSWNIPGRKKKEMIIPPEIIGYAY